MYGAARWLRVSRALVSLMSPRMVQRMSSTAVTAAAVGQRHQRAVTTPRSDPPRAASTPQAITAASSALLNSPQFSVCTGGSVIQKTKTKQAPSRASPAGTRQARHSARVRRGSDIGAASSTWPERAELLVIRFIAINPPSPSRNAACIV